MPTKAHSPDAQRRTYAALRAQALQCTDLHEKWLLLQAAHIVGQQHLDLHWDSHALMLGLAWQSRNLREVFGQLIRLSLVPLGHWVGRLPAGNPGTSDVSAFAPQATSPALQERIARAAHRESEPPHLRS